MIERLFAKFISTLVKLVYKVDINDLIAEKKVRTAFVELDKARKKNAEANKGDEFKVTNNKLASAIEKEVNMYVQLVSEKIKNIYHKYGFEQDDVSCKIFVAVKEDAKNRFSEEIQNKDSANV